MITDLPPVKCTVCGNLYKEVYAKDQANECAALIKGNSIYPYYGSKYDMDRFDFVRGKLHGDGVVCDACIESMVGTGELKKFVPTQEQIDAEKAKATNSVMEFLSLPVDEQMRQNIIDAYEECQLAYALAQIPAGAASPFTPELALRSTLCVIIESAQMALGNWLSHEDHRAINERVQKKVLIEQAKIDRLFREKAS